MFGSAPVPADPSETNRQPASAGGDRDASSLHGPAISIGWAIAGSLAIAAGLELSGRFLFKAYGVGYGVTGMLTLLAMAVWAGSAVYVIRRAHGVPRVTRTLFMGACLIVFSQAVSMGQYFALPGVTFLMRTAQPLLVALEDGGFVVGLALVFAGFYLSIIEAARSNARLKGERQALADEVAERARAEEALEKAYADTELRVQERTASLQDLNQRLLDEIAQRAEFERALQASETRYRTLAEASQDVIFIINRDDTVAYANSFSGKHLGIPQEDIIGRKRSDLFPPESDRDQRQNLGRVFQTAEPLRVERRAELQNGEGWQDTHLIPLKDKNGNVTAVLGVSRDITERKQAEEALRSSEERYRGLIEQASDVVWRIDTQGRFTFVSPVAEHLVGYKPEELLGKSFLIIMDEQSARESLVSLRRRMAGEFGTHSMRIEAVYRRKDGSLFPGEVSTSPIFDPAGNLIEIQAITRDITERKRAQEALQRRVEIEELVAATSSRFLNASSDEIEAEIVRTLETVGRFLGVDRTFVRLFSTDSATFGRDYEWFAEGLQPRSLSALRLHLGSFEWDMDKLMRGENLVVPRIADLPSEASAERILWEAIGIASIVLIALIIGDSVGGFLGLTSERTEHIPTEEDIRLMRLVAGILSNALLHQRAEQTLRESEERHRSLIEGLSEAVYRMTLPDGKYEYMGPAAGLVFGYPAEFFMNRPKCIREIVHPDSSAHIEEMWNRLLRGDIHGTYEYKIIDPEGNDRWILQSNTLIRNEAGAPVAVEGICRNNTEEKLAHQLIEEQRARFLDSAKMSILGEMASNIAHEISNPLAIVSGSAEQLQNLLQWDPVPVEYVPRLTDTIMRNVSRIQMIVKGLRNFAREGEQDPFLNTSLKSIVDDTVVLCQDLFTSHRVLLSVDEIPEDLAIECRATQIMEVLFNLLSNALHAVEDCDDKWVAIRVADEGSEVALSVADSGPGVLPEIAKTLFGRFVTSKEFGKGMGLGLSISKRIVLAHNGSLSLDTTCPNTRFVVRMPKQQKHSVLDKSDPAHPDM